MTEGREVCGASCHTPLRPVAVEATGVFGPEAHTFLLELGRYIREESGEALLSHHLFQRIAVSVQRVSIAAVMGTSPVGSDFTDIL